MVVGCSICWNDDGQTYALHFPDARLFSYLSSVETGNHASSNIRNSRIV